MQGLTALMKLNVLKREAEYNVSIEGKIRLNLKISMAGVKKEWRNGNTEYIQVWDRKKRVAMRSLGKGDKSDLSIINSAIRVIVE